MTINAMVRIGTVSAALGVSACAARAGVTQINFDFAPTEMPQAYYATQGVSAIRMAGGLPGPSGQGLVTAVMAPAGLPSPGGGRVLVPYANLAGALGSFEMVFSTPVSWVSLWSFGPQAVTVRGFDGAVASGVFSLPADPSRSAGELSLGMVGGAMRFTRIVIEPTAGAGPGDPAAGPMHYDVLRFAVVPSPGVGAAVVVGLGALGLTRRR